MSDLEGTPTNNDPAEGRLFSNRYRTIRHIARGGMAEVYLAHDELLDRPVALKVLFPELSTDQAFVARFRREAQSAAKLSQSNIVSVYDWGEDGLTYFIVMEFVDGYTLSQLIRNEGPLRAERAAAIGADVAAALGFAHRKGVVHRDVKPGNVLINKDGDVKVTDFGIARARNVSENLTQIGAVMGTATYFSPEQAQGLHVDERSDIYSLAVVLYEMVTGHPPFRGDNPVAIASKHVTEQAVPPRVLNPAVPAAFEAIVMKAMSKDVMDRYASAEELRADLLRFCQGKHVEAPPPTMATPAILPGGAVAARYSADGGTQVVPVTRPGPVQRRTRRLVVLLVILVAALAAILFGIYWTLIGNSTTKSPVQVDVPNVIGLSKSDAADALNKAGFETEPQSNPNDADKDTVYDQDPKGGEKLAKGEKVKIFISQGPTGVQVPRVVGLDVDSATRTLQSAGFIVQTHSQDSDSVPERQVISQDPSDGSTADKGSTVKLTVSSGKTKVQIPDTAGQDPSDVANQLGQIGLKSTSKTESSATVDANKVIGTDPAAGTQVDKGSTVTVLVSSGPPPVLVTVPDTVGKTEAEASFILQSAGFKVSSQDTTVTNDSDVGRVQFQNPAGGAQAPKGSTITIAIGRKS